MLDVRRLQLLCDLSRLGTIAAVAGLHAYTPSAVSQQLSALEREAGVPLLERTGRRVTLTAAGRLLVEHGDGVLAALEEAGSALAALRAGLTGPLRIGAFPTAVRALLPSALVALGREHPGLELSVTELDPVAIPAALRERRLDVGLVNDYELAPGAQDPPPGPGLEATPLLDEAVFLAFPASSRAQSPPGDEALPGARDADWILASPGTLCHTATLHVCRAAGFTPRARHHADDFATVLALVAAGQGVSLVPQLAATRPPAGVRLVPLPVRRRNRIAYRRGAAAHPAVAAFVSRLRVCAEAFLAAGTSGLPGDMAGKAGRQLVPRQRCPLGQAAVNHHIGAERADLHLRQHRRHGAQRRRYRRGEARSLADPAAQHDQPRVDHRDHAAHGPGDQPGFFRHHRDRPLIAPGRGGEHTAGRYRAAHPGLARGPDDAGRGRHSLQRPPAPRVGRIAGEEWHEGDLARHPVHAAAQPAAEDEAHADARADVHESEALTGTPVAVGLLGERGRVHVVLERH